MMGLRSGCFVRMVAMSWRCSAGSSLGEMYDPMSSHWCSPEVRIVEMVLGDRSGVFDVPIVSIIVPEERDSTFLRTGCTCSQDVVTKLKRSVFVRGDLGFGEDTQIEV